MNWQEYVEFLTSWAPTYDWVCPFRRITEHSNVLFLELEERVKVGDFSSGVNSVSVYEFEGNAPPFCGIRTSSKPGALHQDGRLSPRTPALRSVMNPGPPPNATTPRAPAETPCSTVS